jgi:hypothetical protein
MIKRLYAWVGIKAGLLVGYLICEPQLRLGRRRHNNPCVRCGDDCGAYRCEKLCFPPEPADASTIETMQRMADAEYVAVCIDCSAEVEA